MTQSAQMIQPPNTLRAKVGGGFGINPDAIAKAEEQSMGEGKELEELKSHPSYNSAFVNVFSKETDGEGYLIFFTWQKLREMRDLKNLKSKLFSIPDSRETYVSMIANEKDYRIFEEVTFIFSSLNIRQDCNNHCYLVR